LCITGGPVKSEDMQRKTVLIIAAGLLIVGVAGLVWHARDPDSPPAPNSRASTAPAGQGPGYVGAAGCRKCHEKFHHLWATSHHGLAMQPFTADLARTKLPLDGQDVTVGQHTYRPEMAGDAGHVRQTGPEGERILPIAHVMGGKNVYYALTPLDRGRLQVLPIAYDVRAKRWYDMASSGVRHFADGPADAPLPWTDAAFTFNTSCHSCHVSQLQTNYDIATNSYRTTWAEPGINCETCHGPAGEHVRVCEEAPDDHVPEDLAILSYKTFTVAQANTTCAPCHAKMTPVTAGFRPGDSYFDHYDLVSLEHADFYPDGRDLGENYTYTSWRMSPCATSGKLGCIHCHTSSGRYRFAGDKADNACLPCHKDRVANAPKHTHHPPDKPSVPCVACHMPTTRFARMARSDHSMRPPTPAATLAYKSPNACNLCHTKKTEDAKWADRCVRKWHENDYQKPVLDRASLIAAARARDWRRLDEMEAHITAPNRDEMYAVGLIRLLTGCTDQRKYPVLIEALSDPSPLVRSSAADGLTGAVTPIIGRALIGMVADDTRLVRIRAARALASYPRRIWQPEELARLDRATKELEASFASRPDDWASHYNKGNYLSARQDVRGALASYEMATALRPRAVGPLVNASLLYAALGRRAEAQQALTTALSHAPDNAAVHLNMGLLLAEKPDLAAAERHLRAAVKADPTMAQAAHNLGVLLYKTDRPAEAIRWCRKAVQLQLASVRYSYTLAIYLDQTGDADGAVALLTRLVEAETRSPEVYALLARIYRKQGKWQQAKATCRRVLDADGFPDHIKSRFRAILRTLEQR